MLVANDNLLNEYCYNTLRYFDLSNQAVTVTQMWRTLIQHSSEEARAPHWQEIQQALIRLIKTGQVGTSWGYYFLAGREHLVAVRLQHHRLAQMKWKLIRRLARYLAAVPFVRLIALSGSLAAGNTKPESDLDLFIVAEAGHIWTVRLGLLFVAQGLGRRRKYWEGAAPDKICLNHYVTTQSLVMTREIQNVFTAITYHGLIPLNGPNIWQQFQAVNEGWIKRFLIFPNAPDLPHRLTLEKSLVLDRFKKLLENILAEPLFTWLEMSAEKMQRRAIGRHSKPDQTGRVVLSNHELAFHPESKVPGLLARFAQGNGSKTLL